VLPHGRLRGSSGSSCAQEVSVSYPATDHDVSGDKGHDRHLTKTCVIPLDLTHADMGI